MEVLREFKTWNLDLNATDNDGYNIAHLAAQLGNVRMLEEIKTWGVDIHATTKDGQNAVALAAKEGKVAVLKVLEVCPRISS